MRWNWDASSESSGIGIVDSEGFWVQSVRVDASDSMGVTIVDS